MRSANSVKLSKQGACSLLELTCSSRSASMRFKPVWHRGGLGERAWIRCSGSGVVRLGGGTSARGSVAAPTPLMAVGWAAPLVLAMTVPASLADDCDGCCAPAVPAACMPA